MHVVLDSDKAMSFQTFLGQYPAFGPLIDSGVWCRYTECSKVWAQTTDYFQVVGIILGQLTVGFLGDWLGRRWGMIQVVHGSKVGVKY